MRGDDLVLADDLRRRPSAPSASSGMNSMKRTSTPRVAPERGEVDDLVVVDAALHDGVDLDRVEARPPGRRRCRRAPGPARRGGSSRTKRSARERVEADVDPPQPGGAQLVGEQAQRGAVGRHRQIGRAARDRPTARSAPACSTSTGRWARTVGSPPVRRMPSTSKRSTTDRGEPLDLLERRAPRSRQPRHPLLRHAVRAAEVAAVGDRDPQVADDAPEGIDQILHARIRLPPGPG